KTGNMRKLFLIPLFFAPLLMQAQTDTTAKLKDAAQQWAVFNASNQTDTSMIASMQADYNSVLGTDSLNATANQGLGDIYNSLAYYWANLAQPLESSNPTLYATYITKADNYTAL